MALLYRQRAGAVIAAFCVMVTPTSCDLVQESHTTGVLFMRTRLVGWLLLLVVVVMMMEA